MKKTKILLIGIFYFIAVTLMFRYMGKQSVEIHKEYRKKKEEFYKIYKSYKFEGKVIDIKRVGRTWWLFAKSPTPLTISKENKLYIKLINDSIFRLQFNGMLYPNYHIPIKKEGYIYKDSNSTAVYYKYKGKTYLLSDRYCPNFDAILYYDTKDYQYPCDSTIKKITTDKYWYIVKDTLKNN